MLVITTQRFNYGFEHIQAGSSSTTKSLNDMGNLPVKLKSLPPLVKFPKP